MKNVHLITEDFNCTPQASELLEKYVSDLKHYFMNHDDYDEDVVEDILIACEQKLLGYTAERADKTILEEDVKKVIRQLGTTDLIETNSSINDIPQKLYRDAKNGIIGGVCAGLSAYLHIPTWVVRLAFILLTFTSFLGIIVYLILRYIIPPVQSKSDELRMVGKPISIATLTKDVSTYTKKRVIGLVKWLGIIVGILVLLGAVAITITTLMVAKNGRNFENNIYEYRCADGAIVDVTYYDKKQEKITVNSKKLGGSWRFTSGDTETTWVSPNLNAKVATLQGKGAITVTQGSNTLHESCLINKEFNDNGNIYSGLVSEALEGVTDEATCSDMGGFWDEIMSSCVTTTTMQITNDLFDTGEYGHNLILHTDAYGSIEYNSFVDSTKARYLQGVVNGAKVPVTIDISLITPVSKVSSNQEIVFRTAPIVNTHTALVSLGLFQYSKELQQSVHVDTYLLGEKSTINTIEDDIAQITVNYTDADGKQEITKIGVGENGFRSGN